MSTAGCAEALLSQSRDRAWAGWDLADAEGWDAALSFLTAVLDDYEEMLKKEPGWVERTHEPAYIRTEEPNPNPVPHWGPYGIFMGTT